MQNYSIPVGNFARLALIMKNNLQKNVRRCGAGSLPALFSVLGDDEKRAGKEPAPQSNLEDQVKIHAEAPFILAEK